MKIGAHLPTYPFLWSLIYYTSLKAETNEREAQLRRSILETTHQQCEHVLYAPTSPIVVEFLIS